MAGLHSVEVGDWRHCKGLGPVKVIRVAETLLLDHPRGTQRCVTVIDGKEHRRHTYSRCLGRRLSEAQRVAAIRDVAMRKLRRATHTIRQALELYGEGLSDEERAPYEKLLEVTR